MSEIHRYTFPLIQLPAIEVRCTSGKLLRIIDPLHKWRLNLNNNTWYILRLTLMFKTKKFPHECEAKNVPSIVIQIKAPFMQRVNMEELTAWNM